MFSDFYGGVDEINKKGAIYNSQSIPQYLLVCFMTPFFCELDGKRIECPEGMCLLHRPGSRVVHGSLTESDVIVNHWLWFDAEDSDIAAIDPPFDVPIILSDTDIVKNSANILLAETVRCDRFSGVMIDGELRRLLISIKRAGNMNSMSEGAQKLKFNALRLHVMDHCSEKWTLRRMADRLGYSTSQFCNIYSSVFNISPMEDLLAHRMKLAMRLLRGESFGIGEIAGLCGFSSIHYFSDFFKKRTGVSPTEYRIKTATGDDGIPTRREKCQKSP